MCKCAECVANADEQLGELFLSEKSISNTEIKVRMCK